MATCALTTGFERYNCEAPAGGIEELYVLPYSSFTSVTVAAHEISAITATGTWWGYELSEEVGLLETVETKNLQNNSLFYETNCSFTLNKMDATKSNELSILVTQRVVFIVKTVSGEYFFVGDSRGAHKAGGTNNATSGTAMGDLNGYTINLRELSTHNPYEVQQAVIDGLTIDYNS